MGLQIMQVYLLMFNSYRCYQMPFHASNFYLLSLLQVEAVIDFLAGVGVKGPDATKVRTCRCPVDCSSQRRPLLCKAVVLPC